MYDASALVTSYLELSHLAGDPATWSEARFSNNPPRAIRLRRLVALFRAFGLPWDVVAFVRGALVDPTHPGHAALREVPGPARREELPQLFARLFDYRLQVDRVLQFNSTVMEASGYFALGVQRIEQVNRPIYEAVRPIDELLGALIDPERRRFTRDQLVAHGFPTDELDELDADWM